ncbi:WD40 repeat-like protein [Daedaleopsis nitida]|nr:WD40 repeat-like protein [Daedaleopsis nitida]
MSSESAGPHANIAVPSPVSALALGPDNTLCVGSGAQKYYQILSHAKSRLMNLYYAPDDGSVRWYHLPSTKVSRAIKSLGAEISSIAWLTTKKDDPEAVWIACGRNALRFPASSAQKMIMTAADASPSLVLGEDEDDVLNELSISDNGKHLAFSSDSGAVGVVDLSSLAVRRMRSRHNTVCGAVKSIPDRPNELVSGGYDSALLHFDVAQGTILSRVDITAPAPSEGVSLSPPFVLSVSVSASGLLAASTADGRVWLGGGGEKRPDGKKKRARKWDGLKESEGIWLQVADGPVVSVAFTGADAFVTCSLLGIITQYLVSLNAEGSLEAAKNWSAVTSGLEKVNAMAADGPYVVLGGFDTKGKGIVEVWLR